MYNKPQHPYDDNTINSPNFIARYAHRTRIKKALKYVIPRMDFGRILDYGCGSGVFISNLEKIKPNISIGYEPFLEERYENDLPIYTDYNDIIKNAPYSTITIFETLEHLQWTEIGKILTRCNELLSQNGLIIISVPIEVGPALLFKTLNRMQWKCEKYNFLEIIFAAIFGVVAMRDCPDAAFMEHKGFDFRHLIKFIKSKGWICKVLCYSPFPIKCWYGNSQAFLIVRKQKQ